MAQMMQIRWRFGSIRTPLSPVLGNRVWQLGHPRQPMVENGKGCQGMKSVFGALGKGRKMESYGCVSWSQKKRKKRRNPGCAQNPNPNPNPGDRPGLLLIA